MKGKKPIILSMVTGTVAGLTSYLVMNPKARNKIKNKIKSPINQLQSEQSHFMNEKIGHPDPTDMQDSEMVSEGAQTAVQYYNEKMVKI